MKKKKLTRRKSRLSMLDSMVRGAIGKEYVIKQYSYGAVKTRYPRKTMVPATSAQQKCRSLFKEAVAYAKSIVADPLKKAQWQKRLCREKGIYNAVLTEYLVGSKRKKQKQIRLADGLIQKSLAADADPLSFAITSQLNNNNQNKQHPPQPVLSPGGINIHVENIFFYFFS